LALQEGQPGVELFTGTEGLKTVLNTILGEAKTEVLICSDGESFLKKIPGWSDAYILRRAARQIKTRIIVPASESNLRSLREIQQGRVATAKNTNLRLLPAGFPMINSGFDVYNHKVVLYAFDKQSAAVIITSPAISALLRTVFEILWIEAGRYEKSFNNN
jgi:hypothetical protein